MLLIDPDVFFASEWGTKCEAYLSEIVRELPIHRLIVDNDEIEYEYINALRSLRDEKNHPASRILKEILQPNSINRVHLSSDYDRILSQLASWGCKEPVEPRLLGVVSNNPRKGVTLILLGANNQRRTRILHDSSILWAIQRYWPLLDVRFIDDIQIVHAEPLDRDHAKKKSKAFETMCGIRIQDVNGMFRCVSPPLRSAVQNEQIDIYGTLKTGSDYAIVVGECKLRAEGNEDVLIDDGDIKQLYRKVSAVEYFLKNDGRAVSIQAWIVSNASGFNEDAKRMVRELEDYVPCKFWRAEITSGWSRKEDWWIRKIESQTIQSS